MIDSRFLSRTFPLVTLALLGLLASLSTTAAADADRQAFSEQKTSAKGNFHVRYRSTLHPITINRIHHWVLRVETSRGEPVKDALITVEGGMPEHDHGLATSPRVSPTENAGDYLLEGLRFHMPGYWELTLSIKAASVSDTVIIPLQL